jgi:3-hydroxyisobutyrate dehydrogenase-like beta-hydroxyacid dehydrogenase
VARVPADGTGLVGVIDPGAAFEGLRRRLAAAGVRLAASQGDASVDADAQAAAIETLAADASAVVTLLPSETPLRATLAKCAGARGRALVVLDLSPVAPAMQRDLHEAFRTFGMVLLGARLLLRFRDGVAHEALYVDDDAMQAPALRGVLAALADDVVATGAAGRAKALGLIDDLLTGVNAAAVGEALSLARHAGLDVATLTALLQKGSGATAVMQHRDVVARAAVAQDGALARVAGAAQQLDHSLLFGGVAIGALIAQSQSAAARGADPRTARATA